MQTVFVTWKTAVIQITKAKNMKSVYNLITFIIQPNMEKI